MHFTGSVGDHYRISLETSLDRLGIIIFAGRLIFRSVPIPLDKRGARSITALPGNVEPFRAVARWSARRSRDPGYRLMSADRNSSSRTI